jgi:hypothetical protein
MLVLEERVRAGCAASAMAPQDEPGLMWRRRRSPMPSGLVDCGHCDRYLTLGEWAATPYELPQRNRRCNGWNG